ncbi:5-carboxymethyl-2-hydroxymuconate isomerase [Novosphingobium endophyticum]|uniref:5-carboxymethyl-2-hydroxymuconate isomerase n=1 Tax=Novosphingobium endophyticum TaxID=1955250 RepID=A0A916TV00_9SPHN|nr:fumarylacetoacetate hydrolase family protein [Novosphingobium endophyticum]GGC12963.1 5-carboxymethyl-2-hydroxymuconate isomerase [Novosphingobium endophyticum]
MTTRFISFLNPAGEPSFGIVDGDGVIDLGRREAAADLAGFIAAGGIAGAAKHAGAEPDHALDAVTLLPVIPAPPRIICVGLNYRAHVAETGRPDSERPTIFLRLASSQVAHGAPMIRPRESERFDYEGELAVIIGKAGRRISQADALDHVAGYSCYNDGSVRDWQKHTSQWAPGKNFPSTGAFGPWMIPAADLPGRESCALVTRLNGQEVQRATLSQMIFSIEELIAYASIFTRLEPGDVIVSGTPGGVGDRRDPPLYMRDGDQVTVEIDGIGMLSNPVADEG